MKFKSTLLAQASGSLGGSTYSHNRGGMYIRNRSLPTQPNSEDQQKVKNIMASLSSQWVNTLTAQQRLDWETYSLQVPLIDRLGEPRNIGGIAMFNRTNIPLIQAVFPAIIDAPTIFDLGTFTPPEIDSVTTTDVLINFTPADEWASTIGGHLLVLTSRPQNPTINFFKGPFRFAGSVNGALVAPTSPATIPLAFTGNSGQRIFVQMRISQADGRLSLPMILPANIP